MGAKKLINPPDTISGWKLEFPEEESGVTNNTTGSFQLVELFSGRGDSGGILRSLFLSLFLTHSHGSKRYIQLHDASAQPSNLNNLICPPIPWDDEIFSEVNGPFVFHTGLWVIVSTAYATVTPDVSVNTYANAQFDRF